VRRLTPRIAVPIATAAVACALAVPSPAQEAPACTNTDRRATSDNLTDTAAAVLCLLQAQRAERALPRYLVTSPLGQAAAGHAEDMVRNGFFGHVSSDGRRLCDRVRSSGYLKGSKRRYHLGETLVYGINKDSTPAALATNLLASAKHRRLLLKADLRDIGVAVAFGLPFEGDTRSGATVVVDLGRRITNRSRSFKGAKACVTSRKRTS